jgi:hypothetical protein
MFGVMANIKIPKAPAHKMPSIPAKIKPTNDKMMTMQRKSANVCRRFFNL